MDGKCPVVYRCGVAVVTRRPRNSARAGDPSTARNIHELPVVDGHLRHPPCTSTTILLWISIQQRALMLCWSKSGIETPRVVGLAWATLVASEVFLQTTTTTTDDPRYLDERRDDGALACGER